MGKAVVGDRRAARTKGLLFRINRRDRHGLSATGATYEWKLSECSQLAVVLESADSPISIKVSVRSDVIDTPV
jgi:hypothetical protein